MEWITLAEAAKLAGLQVGTFRNHFTEEKIRKNPTMIWRRKPGDKVEYEFDKASIEAYARPYQELRSRG